MTDKPFVYLSVKSLRMVCDWCDANPQHPLSEAYYDRCVGIGEDDPGKVADSLANFSEDHEAWAKVHRAMVESRQVALQARDMVGRLVFEHIKREVSKK